MSYQFDLEVGVDPPFSDALSTEIVEFFLGHDLERDMAVLMSIMLVPMDEAYDIRFGIREKKISQEWKVSAPDYSKETVDAYIPKRHRKAVNDKIKAAVVALITKVSPKNVTMETFYANLEVKALAKYDTIIAAMHECNYIIDDAFRDRTTLKDHWLFKKAVQHDP